MLFLARYEIKYFGTQDFAKKCIFVKENRIGYEG